MSNPVRHFFYTKIFYIMNLSKITIVLILFISNWLLQGQHLDTNQQLDSVVISSSRIDLPFKENSRSITLITAKQIENSGTSNLSDLLRQQAGIDIRQRGLKGMQADLYIRGGSFDQTLLLINGIKLEDAQTGHHTLNLALPLEVIERVEIIKGPAARIFGQNAFTGAVNIVTKRPIENTTQAQLQVGSYSQLHFGLTTTQVFDKASFLIHASRNTSDGYRYNTDFDNQNYFVKALFNTKAAPIELVASFQERKFGANGFYANPSWTDQYEETQASVLGVSTSISQGNWTFRPRLSWRRNQDMFLLFRNEPLRFRNLHQTNKISAEFNGSYTSDIGITGFGIDVGNVWLSSNNLGERHRFQTTLFLEHRFLFFNASLDVTPGVAVNYFSDFDFYTYPGVDLGFSVNENLRLFGNLGYTYRVPTYTDLHYSDPTTIGNSNLSPEAAFAQEFGATFSYDALRLSAAFFNRNATDIIDYVKEDENDLWQAQNIRKVTTTGVDVEASYAFEAANMLYRIDLGYQFLEDSLSEIESNFSKYALNSLRHNFVSSLQVELPINILANINYRYSERTSGDSFNLVNVSLRYTTRLFEINAMVNNVFNDSYTETNSVPMPGRNYLFGVGYTFK